MMSRDAMGLVPSPLNAAPDIYTYIGYKPATFHANPAAQILRLLTGQNAIFLSGIVFIYF